MIGRASRGTTGWIGSSQATPRFGFNSLKDFLAVRRPRQGSERWGQCDTGDQRWRF